MTAVPSADFRRDFPEFANVAAYPEPVVNFWLGVADLMLSTTRWGNLRNLGMQMFAAHNLALEKLATNTAARGGVPGMASGAITSKSVGPASVSYDTQASVSPDAGHWNMTIYGQRLYQMIRMFGAGPIQAGIGVSPFGAGFFNGGAWPGPYYPPATPTNPA